MKKYDASISKSDLSLFTQLFLYGGWGFFLVNGLSYLVVVNFVVKGPPNYDAKTGIVLLAASVGVFTTVISGLLFRRYCRNLAAKTSSGRPLKGSQVILHSLKMIGFWLLTFGSEIVGIALAFLTYDARILIPFSLLTLAMMIYQRPRRVLFENPEFNGPLADKAKGISHKIENVM